MLDAITARTEPLERWSATLLLAAGGLWVLDALFVAIRTFTSTTVPNVALILTVVPAMLLVLLGVAGYTRGLAAELPGLGGAAAALAALALVAVAVNLVWLLAATLFDAPNPHIAVLAVSVLVMGLALVLFAAGSALAGTPSRTVGLLLVGFVAVWILWLLDFAVGVVPGSADVLMHVLFAATTLGAGYADRTEADPLAAGATGSDATA